MLSSSFDPTSGLPSLPPYGPGQGSRAQVGFIEGGRPQFTDETASLLRTRLQAAALALAVVAAAVWVSHLFAGRVPLVGLRGLIVVGLAAACFLLRGPRPFTLTQLRWFEIGVFGAVAVQMLLMMYARIAEFARQGDAVALVAVKHGYLGGWSALILIYALLMPNTWRRAAAVLVPAALAPYGLLAWMSRESPGVSDALAQDLSHSPLPLPLVAALIAAFGAHTIYAIRREAFKARQLGQYALGRKLGSGGMGEVFVAEHQLLKRPCAVKLIRPDKSADPLARARFEREVTAAARLTHPNSVEIFDYGHADDGTFYYVMELLPGMNLEEMVRLDGPLPPERAIHFLRQVCGALHDAHAHGLVHRDIKPANIFAAERGGVLDVAELLDYGLVREQGAADGPAAGPKTFAGSPLFMCPEQSKAYDRLDARSDLYSLGAVGYYLVTGRPPFVADDYRALLTAHQNEPVVPPSERNRAVPEELDSILLRCLAKLPANRFQDAASLDAALAACPCAGAWTQPKAAAWWRRHAAAGQLSGRA